jgi:hypothetical protein
VSAVLIEDCCELEQLAKEALLTKLDDRLAMTEETREPVSLALCTEPREAWMGTAAPVASW